MATAPDPVKLAGLLREHIKKAESLTQKARENLDDSSASSLGTTVLNACLYDLAAELARVEDHAMKLVNLNGLRGRTWLAQRWLSRINGLIRAVLLLPKANKERAFKAAAKTLDELRRDLE